MNNDIMSFVWILRTMKWIINYKIRYRIRYNSPVLKYLKKNPVKYTNGHALSIKFVGPSHTSEIGPQYNIQKKRESIQNMCIQKKGIHWKVSWTPYIKVRGELSLPCFFWASRIFGLIWVLGVFESCDFIPLLIII